MSERWERREAKRRQRQAVHGRSLEAVLNAQRNRYPQNDSESLIAPDAMQDSCYRCGAEMVTRACSKRCPNCGARVTCSDL